MLILFVRRCWPLLLYYGQALVFPFLFVDARLSLGAVLALCIAWFALGLPSPAKAMRYEK